MNLSFCSIVDEKVLESIASFCNLSALKALHLDGCEKIDSFAIKALMKGYKNYDKSPPISEEMYISLSECRNIECSDLE